MSDTSETVVHLLRHGEVYNPDGVLYGRRDGFHLSELGRQMADRVAGALADRDLTHIRCSPLERTRETAEPTAASHGLEIVTDERVIESTNVFEGSRFGSDNVLRSPKAWRYLWNPWRPSWGEPYKQVVARMMSAVHDARLEAAGHEALIVSHQLPVWITRLHVEGRSFVHDPRRRQCTQLFRLGKRKGSPHDVCRLAAYVPRQGRGQRPEPRSVLDVLPHHEAQAAAGHQHAIHLADRGGPIGKELKPQLTVRDIVSGVRERHIRRASLPPRDRCICGRVGRCERCSKGQHPGVKVEPDHVSSAAHLLRGEPRYHARTAGDVQHAVAGSRVSQCNDQRRPRCEDSRNQRVLICLSSISCYLPLPLVKHRPLLASHQPCRLPSSTPAFQ